MRKTLLVVVLAACGGGSKQVGTTTEIQPSTSVPAEAAPPATDKAPAGAALESRSGSSVTGMVTIRPMGDGVHVDAKVAGATPGKHGFHFHMVGDCSSPDGKSAGDHWNPTSVAHGAPTAEPHHAGDLGNIEVGADGTAKHTVFMKGLTVAPGDKSVVGRAVIFHAGEDDLKSQPAGNAGARAACGVVNAAQ